MVDLPPSVTVPTTDRPSFEIAVPGSKSLTNRAFVLSVLANGVSRLSGALVAEDTLVMRRALEQLGFRIEGPGETPEIHGRGGHIPATQAHLDLRLSGTSIRFLASLVALGNGSYELDGNARMRQRPIGDQLRALNELGVQATAVHDNDCPPIRIEGAGLRGGTVAVAGDRSSQYLSALLMTAPYAASQTTLKVEGELQSKPFIDMTLALMERFGVEAERQGYRRFTISPGVYQAQDYAVEGDAMSAGYFWAAAASTGGTVKVTNVGERSLQGDRRFIEVLHEMGCRVEMGEGWSKVSAPAGVLRGGSFDLNDMPDQAMTLAVLGLFTAEPVEIRNVANMRIKETDRLTALSAELVKFGAQVDEREDGLLVRAPAELRPARVETYGDHRMAMAFAVAGLRIPGTEILDPACVEKTYPRFFDDLDLLARSGSGL